MNVPKHLHSRVESDLDRQSEVDRTKKAKLLNHETLSMSRHDEDRGGLVLTQTCDKDVSCDKSKEDEDNAWYEAMMDAGSSTDGPSADTGSLVKDEPHCAPSNDKNTDDDDDEDEDEDDAAWYAAMMDAGSTGDGSTSANPSAASVSQTGFFPKFYGRGDTEPNSLDEAAWVEGMISYGTNESIVVSEASEVWDVLAGEIQHMRIETRSM